jgi:hypothetical protein
MPEFIGLVRRLIVLHAARDLAPRDGELGQAYAATWCQTVALRGTSAGLERIVRRFAGVGQ